MRIVQLANFYGPRSGGLRTALHHLGEGYVARGHTVSLVVPGPRRETALLPGGVRAARSSATAIRSTADAQSAPVSSSSTGPRRWTGWPPRCRAPDRPDVIPLACRTVPGVDRTDQRFCMASSRWSVGPLGRWADGRRSFTSWSFGGPRGGRAAFLGWPDRYASPMWLWRYHHADQEL